MDADVDSVYSCANVTLQPTLGPQKNCLCKSTTFIRAAAPKATPSFKHDSS